MFRLRPLLPRLARHAQLSQFPARHVSRTRFFTATPFRRASPAIPAGPVPTTPTARVLVYYAGKRTIYLGTLKLYTVLLFSYTSLLVAPQLMQSDQCSLLAKLHLPTDLPRWVLPTLVVVGAALPLGFISWLRCVICVRIGECGWPLTHGG